MATKLTCQGTYTHKGITVNCKWDATTRVGEHVFCDMHGDHAHRYALGRYNRAKVKMLEKALMEDTDAARQEARDFIANKPVKVRL